MRCSIDYVAIITCSCSDTVKTKVVSTFIFYICLKKDMAEQIAGDLVRKSKVFLFPYFLFSEKHICCRRCCKSFAVSLKCGGKVDPFSRSSAGFSDQRLE